MSSMCGRREDDLARALARLRVLLPEDEITLERTDFGWRLRFPAPPEPTQAQMAQLMAIRGKR